MRFDIITVFPEALESYLSTSILNRAMERAPDVDQALEDLRL